MPEPKEIDLDAELADAGNPEAPSLGDEEGQAPEGPSEGPPPEQGDLTSPQRRNLIQDYQARKALERLRNKVGTKGRYFEDSPEGPSWFSDPVGPAQLHARVTFRGDATKMEMAVKAAGQSIPFFTKNVSGYNADSATNFAKAAIRIIESIHSLY
ncbi:MAG: hypothetical protein Q8K86_05745 [Candidatus Nanopelagicaceae bacterium]|nr:hypothetical protein [Candidatus Nanopelagicaceae bacterium]